MDFFTILNRLGTVLGWILVLIVIITLGPLLLKILSVLLYIL